MTRDSYRFPSFWRKLVLIALCLGDTDSLSIREILHADPNVNHSRDASELLFFPEYGTRLGLLSCKRHFGKVSKEKIQKKTKLIVIVPINRKRRKISRVCLSTQWISRIENKLTSKIYRILFLEEILKTEERRTIELKVAQAGKTKIASD